MEKGKYFVLLSIATKRKIDVNSILCKEITMSWTDGMVGVLPVFDSLEKAKKYIGKKDIEIVEIKTI